MNLTNALVVMLQSSFVLLSGLAFAHLFRRVLRLKLTILRVSILACVALVLLAPFSRVRESAPVPVSWSPAPVALQNVDRSEISTVASSNRPQTVATQVSTTQSRSIEPTSLFVWIWAFVATVLAARFAVGLFALQRIRKTSRPVLRPNLSAPVFESELVRMPFVAGVFRPSVFVPTDWLSNTDQKTINAVLRHESAHIENGDLTWKLATSIVTILLWPQPILWIAVRNMMHASEELCDEQVIASGISRQDYASALLEVSSALCRRQNYAFGIGAISPGSRMAQRIEAILKTGRARVTQISRPAKFLAMIGVVFVATMATMIFGRSDVKNLAPMAPFDVRIVDSLGQPIRTPMRAWIEILDRKLGGTEESLVIKNGSVTIDPSRAEAYTRGHLIVAAKGYGMAFRRVWPVEEHIKEIRLSPPAAIHGRLLLPDGRPASQVHIEILRASRFGPEGLEFAYPGRKLLGWADSTNAKGEFTIEGLANDAEYQLHVWDSQFSNYGVPQHVEIRGQRQLNLADIKLTSAAKISGKVSRAGKPVSGVVVRAEREVGALRADDTDTMIAMTGDDGRYLIEGLGPVPHTVTLDLRENIAQRLSARAHRSVLTDAGQMVAGVDFELLPGATLQGKVVRKGKPVSKALVAINGPAHPIDAILQNTLTDSNGSFRFSVPAGEQRIYCQEVGAPNPQIVQVNQGETRLITIDLDEVTKHGPQTGGVKLGFPYSKGIKKIAPSPRTTSKTKLTDIFVPPISLP